MEELGRSTSRRSRCNTNSTGSRSSSSSSVDGSPGRRSSFCQEQFLNDLLYYEKLCARHNSKPKKAKRNINFKKNLPWFMNRNISKHGLNPDTLKDTLRKPDANDRNPEDDETAAAASPDMPSPVKPWMRYTKIFILFLVWLLFTAVLIMKSEKENKMHQISIPEGEIKSFWIREHPTSPKLELALRGSFLPAYYGNLSSKYLSVWVQLVKFSPDFEPIANSSAFIGKNIVFAVNITDTWEIPIVSKELLDFVPDVDNRKVFNLNDFDLGLIPHSILRIEMKTNMDGSFPTALYFDLSPIDTDSGIVYGAIVLLGLYVLIILEITPRTLAAMMASTMSVAILAAMDERPTMAELISWIDVETLLLLFSMMILVAIFSETGIFDYLAVYAYKVTNGRVWPLVITLCSITAILSTFLDNVTTVLLMTPVTIRLCEVMELNPVPVLMAIVIYSNIGGSITPVGDPPNVIIASNSDVIEAGVDFNIFVIHMSVGILCVAFTTYLCLRFLFRDISTLRYTEPQDVRELRHEISVWQRAAASLSSYSKDEDTVRVSLLKKVRRLANELKRRITTGSIAVDTYKTTLEELTALYPIRNKVLLVKSGVSLLFVVVLFFLHSVPNLNLSLGWTALLGAILLLVLADKREIEGVLARVEWGTLLFFASLFILMEALSRLGLIDWIGRQTEAVILMADKESRLAVAIMLVLWVSALASSFVDNIPLTTMMVRIVTNLHTELDLPLQPLVWALAFGACLGGNGTLIGSSSNVVCAGVAEQHGYRFTFMEYFKVGFPIMLMSVSVSSVYLLVCHVALEWH
ncbi:P protein isoform X2 [Periplaneta americana]|uniref:P protein isoform X2 n=1 Tax=Periplaneta americana TaxID=6978 RepID=UPI0037E71F5A